MFSNVEYQTSKSHLFERLRELDHDLIFPLPSVDIVKFLIREFKFLDIFISLQRFIDEPDMLDVTQKIQTLFQEALVESLERRLAKHFDSYASKLQNKIWLTKMEIRAKYSFPKISPLPVSATKDGIAIPKFVAKFILYVVENLRDLVKVHGSCSFLNVPTETVDLIEDILKGLEFLQNFVSFVSERFIEPPSQHHARLFTHLLAVASHASMLAWLYFSGRGYENKDVAALGEINVSLFLQMKFKPIQATVRKIYAAVLQVLKSTMQSGGWHPNIQYKHISADIEANFLETIQHHLVDLRTNSNSTLEVAFKDDLTILQHMLDFLRANIIRASVQDLKFLQDIHTLVIEVGLLVYSLYEEGEEKEDMALEEVNPALALDLSANIRRINPMIHLTIQKAFRSNLPRNHGLGYIDFLLNNLKEFQSHHSDSPASITKQLEIIQKEFESLQPFLEDVAEEGSNGLDKIRSCATQLIGKAYEVEFLVDACISEAAPVWCLESWLLEIIQEITLVREEVREIHGKKKVGHAMNTVTAHMSSNLVRFPWMNEEIVGLKDVIEKLLDQLIKGTKERDIISIVGMPGLGKTTLAYRLYSDRSVVSHFDIRAQCCVSQVYSRKDLLLGILHEVIGDNSEFRKKQDHELADQLRKMLFQKRYLILFDDVWEASVWDDLIGIFQDANNGSRIILTTRNYEVANYARFQSDPLPLRMFSDDESWELLQKKVFGEESCPPSLKNTGKQIAKKCGQLPLSVSLVAGILAGMEKKKECWEQVASNLGPHIHNDSRAIVEHSYQNLPYHLRSCFLYFGAFLEDSVINVSKLIRLWLSEGFIKSYEGKSLEDIAEGYLENLIGRNLVMATKKCSSGKIKACHIHDLLHDFCKERAKEENILLWIRWDQNENPSSLVYSHKQLAHRICPYIGEGYCDREWRSCCSHAGSIILHKDHFHEYMVSNVFYSFKFLKVLDLEFNRIDSFPTDLVYLRYFAAKTRERSMSSYIANCRNLETLMLDNSGGVMSIPIALWGMVKLRHLHIFRCSFAKENSKSLYGLKTLSYPFFACVQDAELIFRKTPNLQELRCEFSGIDNVQQYHVLNFPTQIEILKIRSKLLGDEIIPFCISAPNLKKLTLDSFLLHARHLTGLALLPNLQVLKLNRIKFDNEEWKVSNGEFPQLEVLKLQHLGRVQEWIVADDAFPKLERLVLLDCRFLKEIPCCFADFCCLKSIEVVNCNHSVIQSAVDIQKTQVEDYQNCHFKFFINERRE